MARRGVYWQLVCAQSELTDAQVSAAAAHGHRPPVSVDTDIIVSVGHAAPRAPSAGGDSTNRADEQGRTYRELHELAKKAFIDEARREGTVVQKQGGARRDDRRADTRQ